MKPKDDTTFLERYGIPNPDSYFSYKYIQLLLHKLEEPWLKDGFKPPEMKYAADVIRFLLRELDEVNK